MAIRNTQNNEKLNLKYYDDEIQELASLIKKYELLFDIHTKSDFDLKWRLSELYKTVHVSDEQKFINISGMQNYLTTTKNKTTDDIIEIKTKNCVIDEPELAKKNCEKQWVKDLYKRSVKRCHPDTIKTNDIDYKDKLVDIYKSINESYENNDYDLLMIECVKVFIKPKIVIQEQMNILSDSKIKYRNKIKKIINSQSYEWSTFSDELKENFLINFMKQNGVRFVDKKIVKDILKRKVNNIKPGQRPVNRLKRRK
jgi:hypothetical protein